MEGAQKGEARTTPKYKRIDRAQSFWGPVDLEELIPSNHPARAIWGITGRLDLREFEEDIRSFKGESGRPRWEPRLLVSVWIYAYSEAVSSVRAIEQMTAEEPGMRWLCGNETINYHTLSSFRMEQKERLSSLFTQVLALLASEDLIDLQTVMQDGTKVRAQAGKQSFHRRRTLEEHLGDARAAVEELDRRSEGAETAETKGNESRAEATRKRCAREKLGRMEAALKEMAKLESAARSGASDQLRVSESEAEARKMKQNDGGFAPSYNIQTSTEAKNTFLVAVSVTQDANDMGQLVGAAAAIEEATGHKPERIVADNGYASRDNVRAMAEEKIDLIAPWKQGASREAGALKVNGIDAAFASERFLSHSEPDRLECPAGKQLVVLREHKHHGERCVIYGATAEDCAACEHRQRCCGNREQARQVHRVVEGEAMQAYLRRMEQPEVHELYKRRKVVAETPHMRWKATFKWRQFSVRGLAKAAKETIWLALTYNVQQWIRLQPTVCIQAVAA